MLDLLQTSPLLFTSCCLILGLLVGSFLNVVIYRLPVILERQWKMQCAELNGHPPPPDPALTLSSPRSSCPNCGCPIAPFDNIPVFSYLLLRGKCRSCGTAISPRYPLVESISGLLCGLAGWHFGFGPAAVAAMLLIWALLALTFIDFDTQLLPDDLTLPLLWLGLLFNTSNTFVPIQDAVIGTMTGYLALWSVYWAFKLITGKEGMGYGDFKLLAALGAWLGWQLLPLIILLSSLVGAIVGIALIALARHGRDIPIPFGPYLAGGGLIALFAGNSLTAAYLQLLTA